jgi:hypothetical protein
MKKNVTKLYRGCVDLRDYDVEKCINNDESYDIFHEGNKMTLTPLQLKNDILSTSTLQKSKTGGKDYHLLSYRWNPEVVKL